VAVKVIKANSKPRAINDKIVTDFNTKIAINALDNDLDADSDTLSIQSVSSPSHGKAEIVNGKIEYTPNSDYSGLDSFTYTITDGLETSKATVSITVKAKDGDIGKKDPYPPIKVDPIEKIVNMFKGMKDAINKGKNEFLFDSGKGDILIDEESKEIKVSHNKAPLPKDAIGDIEDFNLEDNKLEIKFGMRSNLKF
jgi:hypothetical protein